MMNIIVVSTRSSERYARTFAEEYKSLSEPDVHRSKYQPEVCVEH